MNTYISEGYTYSLYFKNQLCKQRWPTTYTLMNHLWFDQKKSLDTWSRKSKMDRHCNGQKPKDKLKLNNVQHEPHKIIGLDSGSLES